jgi:hypothetical protein
MKTVKSFKDLKELSSNPIPQKTKTKSPTIKTQIDRIQKVLSRADDLKFQDLRFNFGKHKGQLLSWVLENDESYLDWLLSEEFIYDKPIWSKNIKLAIQAKRGR